MLPIDLLAAHYSTTLVTALHRQHLIALDTLHFSCDHLLQISKQKK